MTRIMIERRYGRSNHDWLCQITDTGTLWSGTPCALVFANPATAHRVLGHVTAQAALWSNWRSFHFVLIRDRTGLPDYVASQEVLP